MTNQGRAAPMRTANSLAMGAAAALFHFGAPANALGGLRDGVRHAGCFDSVCWLAPASSAALAIDTLKSNSAGRDHSVGRSAIDDHTAGS